MNRPGILKNCQARPLIYYESPRYFYTKEKYPPARIIILCPVTAPPIQEVSKENSGWVSCISSEIPNSNPIRASIASNKPTVRACGCCLRGNLEVIIDRNTTLSIPITISRNVSVRSASHAEGERKVCIISMIRSYHRSVSGLPVLCSTIYSGT